MSGHHPPTIFTPLYDILEKANLLPGFLLDPEKGERLFEIIMFFWAILFIIPAISIHKLYLDK